MTRSGQRPPFFCWIPHHGRSDDLAECLGLRVEYVHPQVPGGPRALRLARRYALSARLMRAQAPSTGVIALQLPPPLLPQLLPRRSRRDCQLLCDMHSGLITDAKWRGLSTLTLRGLAAGDIVLAHNARDAEQIRPLTAAHVVVVGDPVVSAAMARRGVSAPEALVSPEAPERAAPPRVLVPSSGAPDEPLDAIAAAARLVPHARTTITGSSAPRRLAAHADVIDLPGFLPRADYDAAVAGAAVVVALTTRPDIVQRSAFEASLVGARMVLGNTSRALRELYGDEAEWVDPSDPRAIAAGIAAAVARGPLTRSTLREQLVRLHAREQAELAQVLGLLAGRVHGVLSA